MSVDIFLPSQDFTITSSNGFDKTGNRFEEAVKSYQTYKSSNSSSGGSVNFSSPVRFAYFGKSGGKKKATVVVSKFNPAIFGKIELINLAKVTEYTFPDLSSASFSPQENQSTCHNNISGMGEFIGRSVVRQSSDVSIKPMSFTFDSTKKADIETILTVMRETPIYAQVDTPAGKQTYYGWTEDEPTVQWNGDVDQGIISFNLRCPA